MCRVEKKHMAWRLANWFEARKLERKWGHIMDRYEGWSDMDDDSVDDGDDGEDGDGVEEPEEDSSVTAPTATVIQKRTATRLKLNYGEDHADDDADDDANGSE